PLLFAKSSPRSNDAELSSFRTPTTNDSCHPSGNLYSLRSNSRLCLTVHPSVTTHHSPITSHYLIRATCSRKRNGRSSARVVCHCPACGRQAGKPAGGDPATVRNSGPPSSGETGPLERIPS